MYLFEFGLVTRKNTNVRLDFAPRAESAGDFDTEFKNISATRPNSKRYMLGGIRDMLKDTVHCLSVHLQC